MNKKNTKEVALNKSPELYMKPIRESSRKKQKKDEKI